MLPTLDLGSFVIPTAGLVIIAGAWVALSAVERAAGWLGLDVEATYGLAALGLGAGVVGARLAFVALHWQAYARSPLTIVWPLTSGYEAWAGLLVGCAAAFFYGRYRNLPAGQTLDALAPGLLVGLLFVSLADFLAGPGYGVETTLPWGISLFGIRRHAVQIYEMLAALLALLAWRASAARPLFAGYAFLVATAVYSAGRLFTDAFRANAPLTAGGWHVIQLVALGVMVGSLLLVAWQVNRVTN